MEHGGEGAPHRLLLLGRHAHRRHGSTRLAHPYPVLLSRRAADVARGADLAQVQVGGEARVDGEQRAKALQPFALQTRAGRRRLG